MRRVHCDSAPRPDKIPSSAFIDIHCALCRSLAGHSQPDTQHFKRTQRTEAAATDVQSRPAFPQRLGLQLRFGGDISLCADGKPCRGSGCDAHGAFRQIFITDFLSLRLCTLRLSFSAKSLCHDPRRARHSQQF